jgi:hypothetical protein
MKKFVFVAERDSLREIDRANAFHQLKEAADELGRL